MLMGFCREHDIVLEVCIFVRDQSIVTDVIRSIRPGHLSYARFDSITPS